MQKEKLTFFRASRGLSDDIPFRGGLGLFSAQLSAAIQGHIIRRGGLHDDIGLLRGESVKTAPSGEKSHHFIIEIESDGCEILHSMREVACYLWSLQ